MTLNLKEKILFAKYKDADMLNANRIRERIYKETGIVPSNELVRALINAIPTCEGRKRVIPIHQCPTKKARYVLEYGQRTRSTESLIARAEKRLKENITKK